MPFEPSQKTTASFNGYLDYRVDFPTIFGFSENKQIVNVDPRGRAAAAVPALPGELRAPRELVPFTSADVDA